MITQERRYEELCLVLEEVQDLCQRTLPTIPEMQELDQEISAMRTFVVGPAENDGMEVIQEIFQVEEPKEIPDLANLTQEEYDAALKIYPFYREDAELGGRFETYLPYEFGTCEPRSKIVTLIMEADETARFQAHTLLHELRHIFQVRHKSQVPRLSDEERIRDEAKICTVDYKIALAIGGEQYCQETREMARDLYLWWQRLGPPVSVPPEKGLILETVYGPAPSDKALAKRTDIFVLYCGLMAADHYYPNPEEANRVKCLLFGEGWQKKSSNQ